MIMLWPVGGRLENELLLRGPAAYEACKSNTVLVAVPLLHGPVFDQPRANA